MAGDVAQEPVVVFAPISKGVRRARFGAVARPLLYGHLDGLGLSVVVHVSSVNVPYVQLSEGEDGEMWHIPCEVFGREVIGSVAGESDVEEGQAGKFG